MSISLSLQCTRSLASFRNRTDRTDSLKCGVKGAIKQIFLMISPWAAGNLLIPKCLALGNPMKPQATFKWEVELQSLFFVSFF